MFITSPFSRYAPNQLQPAEIHPQNTTLPAVRFGRDALFERNDRFYSSSSENAGHESESLFSLRRHRPKHSPKTAQEAQLAADHLYEHTQGRIKGKAVIDAALKLAEKEHRLIQKDPTASPIEKAMTQIKLANARIAEDSNSDRGEIMLDKALQQLDQAGYHPPIGEANPLYIHGLYNRGAGYFNNWIYKETRRQLGDEEMDLSDADQEGLVFDLPIQTDQEARPIRKKLKEDLPYLDRAIALSQDLQDRGLAQVEYLCVKGEILHTISHLYAFHPDQQDIYDQLSLNAFEDALLRLNQTPSMHYTPRHFKLAENLGQIKIPHLCGHNHQPEGSQLQCNAMGRAAHNLQGQILASGIKAPELTLEEMDSENIMENRFKFGIF